MGRSRSRKKKRPPRAAAAPPAASPATSPETVSPWSSPRLRLGVLFLAVLAVGWIWKLSTREGDLPDETPPVTAPESTEGMDPKVAELIEHHLAAATAAPGEASLRAELGLVYAANALWDEAAASFAAAVALDPGEPLWRFHHALAVRQAGDFEAALALLRRLASEHPSFAPAQQRLGEALLLVGDLAGARAAYGRVRRLEPSAPDGHAGLGEVLFRQGDHAAAARALERALELDPGYGAAHHLYGLTLRRLGRDEEAAVHLARGMGAPRRYLSDPLSARLQQYAVNLPARLAEATLALQAGDAEGAVERLERALEERPENVRVMNTLAMAHLAAGRPGRARRVLERARELEPESFSTAINLATCDLRLGRPERALAHARTAVERAPEVPQAHAVLAMVLEVRGETREALAAARRAVELDPASARAQLHLARLHAALGEHERALERFRAAAARAGGVEALQAWAGVHQEATALGQAEEAARALATARRLVESDPRLAALAGAAPPGGGGAR